MYLVLLLISIIGYNTQDPCTFYNNQGQLIITCVDFISFDQLNFENVTDFVQTISLKPKQPIILDEKLNLYTVNFKDGYDINLENINGFSFSSNPFVNNRKLSKAVFYLKNSVFDFYEDNKRIDYETCNRINREVYFISLFDDFNVVSLNEGITYPDEFCPIEFKNVNIQLFEMMNLKKDNKLKFMKIEINDSFTDLNSTVQILDILDSEIDNLNTDLVYPEVFKKIENFAITGSQVSSIDDDFFINFPKLNIFELDISNFAEFLKNGLRWMRHLNYEVKVNLSDINDINKYKDRQLVLELSDLSKVYDYPEKDFCLFRYFPHEKFVFPIIETKENKKIEISVDVLLAIRCNNQSVKSFLFYY